MSISKGRNEVMFSFFANSHCAFLPSNDVSLNSENQSFFEPMSLCVLLQMSFVNLLNFPSASKSFFLLLNRCLSPELSEAERTRFATLLLSTSSKLRLISPSLTLLATFKKICRNKLINILTSETLERFSHLLESGVRQPVALDL
jgi:hypothetical protein